MDREKRILKWLKRRENKYSKLSNEFENDYHAGKKDAFNEAYNWIKFEINKKS